MNRRTTITLSIDWNDDDADSPEYWNWDVLLDLSPVHRVKVLDAADMTHERLNQL